VPDGSFRALWRWVARGGLLGLVGEVQRWAGADRGRAVGVVGGGRGWA